MPKGAMTLLLALVCLTLIGLPGCSCSVSGTNNEGDDDDDELGVDDDGGGDDDAEDDDTDDDDDTCPGFVLEMRGDAEICDPAGVRTTFTVQTCEGAPVPNITDDNFEVINDETGEPFQSEGGSSSFVEAMNFEFYTILILDLSNSIVENDRLDDVLDGAEIFVEGLVEGQTDNFRHSVGIYAFGSTEASELVQDFTDDPATLYAAINALRSEPGRGSTNLYGAFAMGLDLVEQEGMTDDLVSRNLVLFTDGTHETGDAAELRAYVLAKLAESSVMSYTIGINGDYNQDDVAELASSPDNFVSVDDSSDLGEAFETISGLIDDWSRSNYVMGVCSPLEGENRSLTIRISRGSDSGELKVYYSAVGFNLVGCDAELVALGQGCEGYTPPGNNAPRLSNGYWFEVDPPEPGYTHLLKWSVCDEDNDLSGGQVFTWLAGTHAPFFGDFEIFFDDFTDGAPNAPDCDNPVEIGGIPVDFTGITVDLCADVEVTDGDGNLSNKLTNICVDL